MQFEGNEKCLLRAPASGDYRVNSTLERASFSHSRMTAFLESLSDEEYQGIVTTGGGNSGLSLAKAAAVIIHVSAYSPSLLSLRFRWLARGCARSEEPGEGVTPPPLRIHPGECSQRPSVREVTCGLVEWVASGRSRMEIRRGRSPTMQACRGNDRGIRAPFSDARGSRLEISGSSSHQAFGSRASRPPR